MSTSTRYVINPFDGKLTPVRGNPGPGSGSVFTINTISPDGTGNFTLTAGNDITLTPGTNGLTIGFNGGSGVVTSVSGTAGQIDVSPNTGATKVSIDPGYIGQPSITTVGTITSGIWRGAIIGPPYGGTGVNNGAATITIPANFSITGGAYTSSFTLTGNTSVTFPTSGTLATTAPSGTLTYFSTSGGTSFPGYLPANGAIVSQATYPALFSQLGLLGAPNTIWTNYYTNNISNIVALAYGASVYVAAGSTAVFPNDTIQTSTNAITWLVRNVTNANFGSTLSLIFGTVFVSSSSTGLINTSTDGISWTSRTSGTSSAISSLDYGNSLYLYGGSGGVFSTSTDATTWTSKNITNNNIVSILYNGSSFYVLSTAGQILTSTDASSWTTRQACIPSTPKGFIYGALYVTGSTQGILYSSTDAVTWNVQNSGTSSAIRALTYGNSLYIYGGAGGVLATSTDTITWSSRTSGTVSVINTMVYGAGLTNQYAYGAAGGRIATSTDGITWNTQTSNTTSVINDMCFGTVYLYGTTGGGLGTSTDGVTWTARTSGTTSAIFSVLFANNTYVYAGAGGVIGSSTDGTTWNVRTSNTTSVITSIGYVGSTFVASGVATGVGSGMVLTSTDATTWVFSPQKYPFIFSSMVTNTNIYAMYTSASAGGGSAPVATSTDGISWNSNLYIPIEGTLIFKNLSYGNSVFVASLAGAGGDLIITSTDTHSWTPSPLPFSGSLAGSNPNNFAFGGGLFAIGSQSGEIATSTDGTNWYRQNYEFSNLKTSPLTTLAAFSAINVMIYSNKFLFSSNLNTPSIIMSNSSYSYDTATQFQLPTDMFSNITLEASNNFQRGLYIKT